MNEPKSKSIDRLPPHSTEAEQGVLGCCLSSPSDCIPETIDLTHGVEDVFYDLRHQTIWAAIVEMQESGQVIDSVTLMQWLKDRQLLDGIGGAAYLSTLPGMVPSAAHLKYYADIMWEKYLLRKVVQTTSDIGSRVYEFEGDVDELIDDAEKDMSRISRLRDSSNVQLTAKELVNRAINKIEEMHANQGKLLGMSTGFVDLDKRTSGMHNGDMIVIAARPSIGKTSLAMNIAEHVALDQKTAVGVFSLEMTAESLMLRMLCSRARVNIRKIQDGFLAERDFPKLTGTAGKLSSAPLYIDDTGGMSILQLKAKARRMKQQYDIKLLVIDYLQLLHSTSRRSENRQQEIAEISGGIKAIAKELNIPIIVLAQLNRELEKRGPGERPRMSDLRESGAIEQDADLVCLLYKSGSKKDQDDELSAEEEFERDAISVNLFIAKQRNGPIGDVELIFRKSYTRFESAAKINAEETPAEA